jgi:hypothetical protein
MAPGTPNLMAATLVKPGREAEFEDFVINVIVPAGRRTKPHREDGWQLLRPSDNPPEGVTSAYMFVFYGDAPLEEWDLEPLFNEAYGPEEGRQHLDRFLDLIDGEQTLYAFGGEVTRS